MEVFTTRDLFPFSLQFPILAAVMDISIPSRPSSP